MVRIRLRRVGAKKQPSYRIVVAEARSPRDGRFIEKIGFYNPRTEPATMVVDEERALYWLNVGAQPTDTVHRILAALGTLDRLARLQAGEPLEVLLAEAEAEAEARPTVDPRTRREPAPKKKKKTEVAREAAPAPAQEPESQDE